MSTECLYKITAFHVRVARAKPHNTCYDLCGPGKLGAQRRMLINKASAADTSAAAAEH